MSWTLTTSGAAKYKAGSGASSTVTASNTILTKWSDEVEGYICANTRYDWVSNISSVPLTLSGALSDIASSLIAMNIISYDMSGYTSRAEAQTMLDVLNDGVTKTMGVLKDEKTKEFMINY